MDYKCIAFFITILLSDFILFKKDSFFIDASYRLVFMFSGIDVEIHDKLFAIIRCAFDLQTPSIQLQDYDYDVLMSLGKKQSIIPIIYFGLKKCGCTSDRLSLFDSVRIEDIRRYIIQTDSLKKLIGALETSQIPFVILKGSYLRDFYPIPELRTCVDIDILVHDKDVDKAIESIELSTRFRFRKRNYHDVSMVSSDVHLELHFNIKENMNNIDKLLEQVWYYSFHTDGFRYYLTPEFQIFHVVAHMSYHMVHGGLGIRPFLDLWLLRNNTKYDDNIIRKMLSDCCILKFYEKCCELVDSWMNDTPVSENLLCFEEYVLNGGVFGSKETALASRQRKHRGLNYFFHRLFMDRHLLETEYPELIDKPYLFPIYQIKRWSRLRNKEKRQQVKCEVKSVNSLNPANIDSFDKLLKSLGL